MRKRFFICLLVIATLFTCLACRLKVDDNVNTDESVKTENQEKQEAQEQRDADPLKLFAMKGPTAMSLAGFYENTDYQLNITSSIEDQLAALKKGEGDIYLIPSNLFAKLKNTGMDLKVLSSNTGNVLSLIGFSKLDDLADLKGKTLALSGRGAVPEIIFNQLLKSSGLSPEDLNVIYLDSPTEAGPIIKQNKDAFLLLPQPFASALMQKVQGLMIAKDIESFWAEKNLPEIVTSVIVCTEDKYAEKTDKIEKFIESYQDTIENIKADPDFYAEIIGKMDIVPEKIAADALTRIKFSSHRDKELKDLLDNFFQMILEENPDLIGGKIPTYD
ncbi:ABC transporter substrate-binding protein [Ezakiella peruensis]|uniref:ABC transporter substrate-binding protein n=1 Tax=Ezakiella peruensis TaxID=1464038 RepID=UPI000C1B3F4A|nr:ABC transporter substrate-binding protein [Ezakiella peruensis]